MTPEQFCDTLKGRCGGNLLSAVLYGSAAAGGAVPGKSGFNVLAVLRTCSLGDLKAVAEASEDRMKKNPPPAPFAPRWIPGTVPEHEVPAARRDSGGVVLPPARPASAYSVNAWDVEEEEPAARFFLRKHWKAVVIGVPAALTVIFLPMMGPMPRTTHLGMYGSYGGFGERGGFGDDPERGNPWR